MKELSVTEPQGMEKPGRKIFSKIEHLFRKKNPGKQDRELQLKVAILSGGIKRVK